MAINGPGHAVEATASSESDEDRLRRENDDLRAELSDLRDAHDLVLEYLEVVLAERNRYRRAIDGVWEFVPKSVQRLLTRLVNGAR